MAQALFGLVASPVIIRIQRKFPHPAKEAYAWLTDFSDDDDARAGAVIQSRRVKERSPTRIVYEGETSVLGVKAWATTEVTLRLPLHWEARVTSGPRTGSRTDYEMVERADGVELTITYRFTFLDPKRQFLVRLLKPLVRRDLVRMWDGFQADMAKELPGT